MPSTKTYALVFASALALTILLALAGQVLEARRPLAARAALETPAKVVFFALFLVLGFTAMPLLLRLFLAGQRRLGNESLALVRLLGAHETAVVLAVWAVCLAGLALAVPAAIRDGLFGREAALGLDAWVRGGPTGVLVANVGMTLDEVRRRSTLAVGPGTRLAPTGSTQVVDQVVFDFEIAGTAVRFPGCRYYLLSTRDHDDPHVESMNIGIAPHALTRAELGEAGRRARERLRADGWASGRFVYRTPAQQALHGGKTSSGEGVYWRKGGALIQIQERRIDDARPGEDAATAGTWTLALGIREWASATGDHDLEFSSP